MYLVVFEVQPKDDRYDDYLSLAAALRTELEQVDGFISVERFSSLTTPGKILSLSAWRDAAAVEAWRGQARHRAAQERGRREIFEDYRIRVAEVFRDYDLASGRSSAAE